MEFAAAGCSTTDGLHKSLAAGMDANLPHERQIAKNRIKSKMLEHFGADGIEYARDIDGQRNVRGFTGVRIKDATSADSWLSLRSGNLTAATPTNGHPPVDAPPNSPEPVEDPDDVPF